MTEEKAAEPRKISFSFDPDRPADIIIQDREKDVNCLVIVVPLTMPKLMAIGFLYQCLTNLSAMFAGAEAAAAARAKPGIIKAGLNDLKGLGAKLKGG